MSSTKKLNAQFIRISSNSFIYLPKKIFDPLIHSYIFQFIYMFSKKSLNPNSFVCFPIHAYVFQKKSKPPIHSYIFQFMHMFSKKNLNPQFIRISSNSFICLPKKSLNPQFIHISSKSYICLPKKIEPPIHAYIFHLIHISSKQKI